MSSWPPFWPHCALYPCTQGGELKPKSRQNRRIFTFFTGTETSKSRLILFRLAVVCCSPYFSVCVTSCPVKSSQCPCWVYLCVCIECREKIKTPKSSPGGLYMRRLFPFYQKWQNMSSVYRLRQPKVSGYSVLEIFFRYNGFHGSTAECKYDAGTMPLLQFGGENTEYVSKNKICSVLPHACTQFPCTHVPMYTCTHVHLYPCTLVHASACYMLLHWG